MMNEAREFVNEVLDMASARGLDVFVVTNGASGTLNHGSVAVAHARMAHREWEAANGYDPDEAWRR